jgi:hypothetical protein
MILASFVIAITPAARTQEPGGSWERATLTTGGIVNQGLGRYFSVIGDVDGDLLPDLALGRAAIGSNGDWLHLEIASGANGATIRRISFPGVITSVAEAIAPGSDLDGDLVPEFYTGSPRRLWMGSTESGAVHVWSGAELKVVQTWQPSPGSRHFGSTLVNLGDLDGDAKDDVAVGSPYTPTGPHFSGRIEVRSGSDGAVLRVIDSTRYTWLGYKLTALEDVDGDGHRDLAASALIQSGTYKGVVLVFQSRTGAILHEFDRSAAETSLGRAIASAGDYNDDGVGDLIATEFSGHSSWGTTVIRLYDGRTGTVAQTFWPPTGYTLQHHDLEGGRDLDGDGFTDVVAAIIAASPNAAPNALVTYSTRDGSARIGGETWSEALQWGIALESWSSPVDGSTELVVADSMLSIGHGREGGAMRWKFRPGLIVESHALRASRGGGLRFFLDFGDVERGQPYVLVASLSSGISLFGSLEIPLQQDALFARTLAAPPPMLAGARGVLNTAGKAHADLRVAAGAMSSWIGRTIYFAAITGSAGAARTVSVAQHLTILP